MRTDSMSGAQVGVRSPKHPPIAICFRVPDMGLADAESIPARYRANHQTAGHQYRPVGSPTSTIIDRPRRSNALLVIVALPGTYKRYVSADSLL
ncbi:MAG: hypothetical protein ACYST5_22595 [Planctomycetota bacterium]